MENLQGTFPRMSQLRSAAAEHAALVGGLRVELGLRAGAGVGAASMVAAVRQLKLELARSSGGDAGSAATALHALAGTAIGRGRGMAGGGGSAGMDGQTGLLRSSVGGAAPRGRSSESESDGSGGDASGGGLGLGSGVPVSTVAGQAAMLMA